jgi:lysophospholipase L1-like esterase
MKLKKALLFCLLSFFFIGSAQNYKEYKVWNPAIDTIKALEGQAWSGQVKDYYDRLPARAEQPVRKEVWNLSKNSAGLKLRFKTNAEEIIVKYVVTGAQQMPHMPATGVSGVDLYSKTINGKWLWAAGKFSFGDTIVYKYNNLIGKDQQVNNREYHLYLPLYNSVKWMEIKVLKENQFTPLPVRKDKPIIVYGTSIAQGACATRPGLAWTNILERKLDRPFINLGFSGNGRLETELVQLLTTIDAKLYVLDCLPNLTAGYISTNQLKKRITNSIVLLQQKRPETPILLTDHSGYTDEGISDIRKKEYQAVNNALKITFDSLVSKGVKNIYHLSKEEISQNIETMVDGVHPNDIGMMQYADAYEKKIRVILDEVVGDLSTNIPVTQRRDANTYDWETRHNQVMQYNKMHKPQLVFMGNSITHFWGGEPAASIVSGSNSWAKYFGDKNAVNMGFGWDRIENVLWRVQHGELDDISPKQIVLMIGTNNLQFNTDDEIVQGLRFLVKAIQLKQPKSNILIMGILPRKDMEERISVLNKQIAKIPIEINIRFADAEELFLDKNKKITASLFSDGLHPNADGYERLGKFIETQILK